MNFEVYQDETLQLINLFILKTCQQDNIFESFGEIICSSPMGVQGLSNDPDLTESIVVSLLKLKMTPSPHVEESVENVHPFP